MVSPTITVESAKLASIITVGVTVLMGIGGVVLLAGARRRRCFLAFVGLSALPLIVGSIGTAVGYAEAGEALAKMGESAAGSTLVATAFAQARLPLYIGAAGFGALLILSFAGLLLCKDLCEPKEKPATELVK